MKRFKDFNDEEKAVFSRLWDEHPLVPSDVRSDEDESRWPWRCPWLWCGEDLVDVSDMEAAVDSFVKEHIEDINHVLKHIEDINYFLKHIEELNNEN